MRKLILAAMLSVSGVALAQTEDAMQDTTTEEMTPEATAEDMQPDTNVDPAAPVDPTVRPAPPTEAAPPAAPPAPMDTTPPMQAAPPMRTSAPMGGMAAGATVAPGNASPERDARGIPVVSSPATAPSGANQMVSVPPGATVVASSNQAAVFATQPAAGEYPICSRTVTDGCVQSYERGRAPN